MTDRQHRYLCQKRFFARNLNRLFMERRTGLVPNSFAYLTRMKHEIPNGGAYRAHTPRTYWKGPAGSND